MKIFKQSYNFLNFAFEAFVVDDFVVSVGATIAIEKL